MTKNQRISRISDMLTQAGIIQFGLYVSQLNIAPFKLKLDYLPSYPQLLRWAAQEAKPNLVERAPERLLATLDSVPLGIAISTATDIPLVWQHRTSKSEFVGAYDIGHPTCLILNSDQDLSFLQDMLDQALRVGLVIDHIVFFLKTTEQHDERIPLTWHALIMLDSVLEELTARDEITLGFADTIRAYCASSYRHQG